ncbi:uncharacterized protein LOC110975539 [Acanthaster planci]|uniref:Uncharacterized protein LOC110975539 n=1 Tax=Acanthaster planci TaxID=133434 RepID=A0A8B7XV88_ACAPL|nr:uncharacterized protein LOC110975539 [Acanthaster planci]XP_022083797.1 uncharacterized protein LOC110975539 [Acanthaster planci]XP_022083798.1 uncharacterized protein LOC110975539 [Acanthaster planci]XP_022083800.1 uncharacterized protein LOC110975539 [Acanthaster planci]
MRRILQCTTLVFLVGSVLCVQYQADSNPAVYTAWPACKKRTEYVVVVKNADRVPGETYHERIRKNGRIKYYFCMPCIRCNFGVQEINPCSVFADTSCSATECAVADCVLDETIHACRLPGDPNNFTNLSAMMDPCDPSKVVSKSTEGSLNEPAKVEWITTSSWSREGTVKTTGIPPNNLGSEPNINPVKPAADKPKSGWKTRDTILVIVVTVIVVIFATLPAVYYWRPRKIRQSWSKVDHSSNEGRPRTLETSV